MNKKNSIVQEIKDLFAQNTGDYTPTTREIENINAGLNQLLEPESWNPESELLEACRRIYSAIKDDERFSRTWANYPDKPEISHADILQVAISKAEGKDV